jgi:hypothetical protein
VLVSAGSAAAEEDGDGLGVSDGLIVTDRVTVDGLGVAMTVGVVVVSTPTGDREGFFVADRVAEGSQGDVGPSVGWLDETAGLGFVGIGLGVSGRRADLLGVGMETVGVLVSATALPAPRCSHHRRMMSAARWPEDNQPCS